MRRCRSAGRGAYAFAPRALNRAAPAVVALLLAAASGACFESTTVLRVKGDGSGTLQQRTIIKKAALAQLRSFSAVGGGRATLDPLSEDQARALARSLGEGVTLASTSPITTDEGEGRESTYAFADVTKLHVSEQPAAPSGVRPPVPADAPDITLGMTHEPNGDAVLHILVPPPAVFAGPDGGGGINPAVLAQLQAVKGMLAGAHLVLAVEPQGALVTTSSPYVAGARVTLLEIDLDQVLADDTLLARLQAAKTPDEVRAVVRGAPGLKINLDPDITVQFTPRD
jgi:hypothetical protein